LIERFHERHERLYTYALRDAPVEIVTLRVAASGRLRRFAVPTVGAPRARPQRARRRVYFAGRGWIDAACLQREALGAGARIVGPAIVEQLDATTVVPPGQRGQVDRFGNLVIRAGGPR
jgi:N-methylhydantoinase A